MTITARELLDDATCSRKEIDGFLDPNQPNWATFDTELGYKLRNSVIKDGIDGCYTFSHYQSTGERRMINYVDRECRVNTYGNSFTQCHQVSDGETWQEYLAAHLGEPIRNFGVGGYGVYQAYRRILKEEETSREAKYIILNIWSDDHFRSLDAWRWIRIPDFRRGCRNTKMFHANPWAYVRIDPETGEVVEHENPYPTPESLYKLCDREYVYENFRNDFVVQIILAKENGTFDNLDELKKLAETLSITGNFSDPVSCRKIAQAVYLECALRASKYIVEKTKIFAEKRIKKLMCFLSYSSEDVINACKGRSRFDQSFVDFLQNHSISFVDTLQKHLEDFRCFRLSPQQYVKRYYIGHYNSAGNHFFALSVKDAIVNWLSPKPPAYRNGEGSYTNMAAKLA